MEVSLTVKDAEASLVWYRDILGFVVDKRYERDGKLMAVSMKAGTVRILLGQDDGARGMDRVKGEGFSLMFTTGQIIDEVAQRIRDRGGELMTEPANMPWGSRVFRMLDPDGFKLVISSERPT
jgi:lactoylglutathione lyase